jgi:hypothetical protein
VALPVSHNQAKGARTMAKKDKKSGNGNEKGFESFDAGLQAAKDDKQAGVSLTPTAVKTKKVKEEKTHLLREDGQRTLCGIWHEDPRAKEHTVTEAPTCGTCAAILAASLKPKAEKKSKAKPPVEISCEVCGAVRMVRAQDVGRVKRCEAHQAELVKAKLREKNKDRRKKKQHAKAEAAISAGQPLFEALVMQSRGDVAALKGVYVLLGKHLQALKG